MTTASSDQDNNSASSSPRTDLLYSKLVGRVQYPDHAAYSYLITFQALRAYRLFAALFLVITAVISIANHAMRAESVMDGLRYIVFFTNLNLYSLIFYFVFTLVLSQRAPKQPMGKAVSIVHSLTYSLNCAFHPLVVLVYWVFLSASFSRRQNVSGKFVSVASHGITLLLLFGEIFLGSMRMNIWQIFPAVFVIILYTIWALGFYAISDIFIYEFLNFNKPTAAYMYPGVFFGVIFFFLFMLGIHNVRDRLFKSKALIIPTNDSNPA